MARHATKIIRFCRNLINVDAKQYCLQVLRDGPELLQALPAAFKSFIALPLLLHIYEDTPQELAGEAQEKHELLTVLSERLTLDSTVSLHSNSSGICCKSDCQQSVRSIAEF